MDRLRLTRVPFTQRLRDKLGRQIGATILSDHAIRLDPWDPGISAEESKKSKWSKGAIFPNMSLGDIGERCLGLMLDSLGLDYEHSASVEKDSPRYHELIAESGMSWSETCKRLPDFKLIRKDGSPGPALEMKATGPKKNRYTVSVGRNEMERKGAEYLVAGRMTGPIKAGEYFIFLGFMEAPVLGALDLVPGDVRNGYGGPYFALSWGDPLDRGAFRLANWRFSNRRPERTGPIFEPLKPIEGLWDILAR